MASNADVVRLGDESTKPMVHEHVQVQGPSSAPPAVIHERTEVVRPNEPPLMIYSGAPRQVSGGQATHERIILVNRPGEPPAVIHEFLSPNEPPLMIHPGAPRQVSDGQMTHERIVQVNRPGEPPQFLRVEVRGPASPQQRITHQRSGIVFHFANPEYPFAFSFSHPLFVFCRARGGGDDIKTRLTLSKGRADCR
jgi:hypothetical protein